MAKLIYCLIIREPDIPLAEFTSLKGNFPQITRSILPKLPRNGKYTYPYNTSYTFHFISDEGFCFICLTDTNFSKRI